MGNTYVWKPWNWGKPTVKQVLETIGLGEYYCRFEEEEFDYDAFLEVTDEQLRELNLKMGPRTKILTEIDRIKREQSSSKKIYITMRDEISSYNFIYYFVCLNNNFNLK